MPLELFFEGKQATVGWNVFRNDEEVVAGGSKIFCIPIVVLNLMPYGVLESHIFIHPRGLISMTSLLSGTMVQLMQRCIHAAI